MVPRLVDHQITLRFKLPEGRTTFTEEADVLEAIASLSDWRYLDEYQYMSERFELYQPDFDLATEDDGIGENESVWVLTFGSSSEIPLEPRNRRDEEQMDALTIVRQIRQIVQDLMPDVQYIRTTEYKKFETVAYLNLNLEF